MFETFINWQTTRQPTGLLSNPSGRKLLEDTPRSSLRILGGTDRHKTAVGGVGWNR